MNESEMVVRVAKAISGSGVTSAASLRKARAAIEAMREPNNREMWAGIDALPTKRLDADETRAVWQAMLDAALTPRREVLR